MEEIILKATERTEKPKKVRNAGFVPGVLSSSDTTSIPVQFESIELSKVVAKHGSNAKIWIELGTDKKFGFIREIQRHPTKEKIIHVAIQTVSVDQEVKMHLPISFHGHSELEHKSMQVQVTKPEIEVSGKAALMPEVVVANVAEKEIGDNVTAADFNLPSEIKILDPEDEIYAVIKPVQEKALEEPEEEAAEEEAAGEEKAEEEKPAEE
jgi:large subunit ribosomal protein L25